MTIAKIIGADDNSVAKLSWGCEIERSDYKSVAKLSGVEDMSVAKMTGVDNNSDFHKIFGIYSSNIHQIFI